jgi:hypothetical protein
MNLEKIYHDMEGKERNILEMVKLYPEWAANMIQMKEGWKSPEEVIKLPLLSIDFEDNTITVQASPDILKGRFSVGLVGIDLSEVKEGQSHL